MFGWTTNFAGLLFSCHCSFPSSPSWTPLLFPGALQRGSIFLLFCLKKLHYKLEPWTLPWDLWRDRWWWSPLNAVWRGHKVTKERGVTCSLLLATGCDGDIEMLWVLVAIEISQSCLCCCLAVSSPGLATGRCSISSTSTNNSLLLSLVKNVNMWRLNKNPSELPLLNPIFFLCHGIFSSA